MNQRPDKAPPNPEVRPKAKRRTFSARYKLAILEEADACTKNGEIEALLRREGLYSSHLTNWRKQRKVGELSGSTKPNPDQKRVKQLEAENAQLQKQLQQAQTVIEVQKKLCDLLGLPSASAAEKR